MSKLNINDCTNEELEEQMKKGIISLEEYDELVGNKLSEKVVSKALKEFDDYKNKLLELPKEEILEKSYETTVRKEFVNELKYMDLYIDEMKALLNRDNLLDEFYKDWLDCDEELSESLDSSFEETVIYLTRYYNDQKKQNEKDLDE